MTLKELRKQKGLTQKQCAEFLGMTTRNYQYYEGSCNEGSAKYRNIYNRLLEYGENQPSVISFNDNISFNTNVVVGTALQLITRQVADYKKRDCFSTLKQFVNGSFNGKICILFGLRRTGKTTLLFQMIHDLPQDKTAYIKIKTTDNMSLLTKDLYALNSRGCKYVFIDEITLMDDFINTAAVLSDIFSMMGMKIVVSGTDSLGFAMANRDELYDRNIMIHTSFISYKEYSRLLGIKSVDKYIEYGGTLKMENMSFDDPDMAFDDVSFRDDESTRKYIDTAISRNIQHSLKNDNFGEYFNQLRELYERNELTNVINRVVENINHRFVLKVIEDEFRSHDLGSAKQLLLHNEDRIVQTALYDIDAKSVLNRLKDIIEVKERNETSIRLSQENLDKVRDYLVMLDLIVNCPNRYESGSLEEHYIIAQPGMRYAISKALIYSLMQDAYFASLSEYAKKQITDKILEDVKGRMLEEIVLLETSKKCSKDKEAFKFKFNNGGEFDMVIYDKKSNTCELYEVKHSAKVSDGQTRYLNDEFCCNSVQNKYGTITGKYVLYRGKDCEANGVQYKNVERYLCAL